MSTADSSIAIEVVYAETDRQVVRPIRVPAGITVSEAINASGIATLLPDGVVDVDRLGVFSRKVAPEQLVRDGDRIEIYRPLVLDPMEARRRRAR